jgi:protein-L-isoaspartate O-methyltransferase
VAKPYERNREKVLHVVEEQRLTHKEEGFLAQSLKRKLLMGAEVEDEVFDLLYPPEVRKFSQIHFTPLLVAKKAADVLKTMKVERMLDVGSGSGKFCILTAILSGISVTGIEQRDFLALAAKKAKNAFRLENVNFLAGSAFEISWKEFDCIYFYNPFCEQKTPERRMRNDVPLQESLYQSYVQQSLSRLQEQKKGSKVMTYHGLGGAMPDTYSLYYQKAVGSDFLKVWIKT